MQWHSITAKEVINHLKSDEKNGLSEKEAQKRLKIYGKNIITSRKKNGILKNFLAQFNDFMIIVLIAAAIISFSVSFINGDADFADPIVILAIVILNAFLGTVQESKAEKALDALKEMSEPTAFVKRDGKTCEIHASDVVPGDIVIFKTGSRAPADCRLIWANSIQCDESTLTGESMSVSKNPDAIPEPLTPLADRTNIIHAGTSVVSGKGEGIAVSCGMNTELGKIANLIMDSADNETPLQKKLAHVGKILGILSLSICVIIFFIGILKHFPPFEMFMISVSLAVAAIPEGLPAIVTIMLAIGVQAMAKKNAIVRNLPAVEALGSASVICSDKTGTLTMNKMEVSKVFADDVSFLCRCAVLCCDYDESAGATPTENAIIEYGLKNAANKIRLDRKYPRLAEIPFDSSRKLMSTAHKTESGIRIISKGAPDILINLCTHVYKNGKKTPLTPELKNEILKNNSLMTDNALRVIAVAYKDGTTASISENNLVFLGLLGLSDPPRPEVKAAVKACIDAGIRPVMITGDHLNTASAIAKQIGILKPGEKAITGKELDLMPQSELERTIGNYSVFARVTPEHKVRIVKAWQKQDQVVAMTGDGVNDAPSLKKADIGCSMGMCGTDVAKSASDIILTDDNFATIVAAVKKGREIYENLKKAIKFLLSSNIGEIFTVFVGLLFGWSAPLYPIQLLWINLVTDSLPALALGLDPVSDDIMHNKPTGHSAKIFDREMWADIFTEGAMIGALAILAYTLGMIFFDPVGSCAIGRTMAFTVLGMSQLFHAFNMRSRHSVFKAGFFKNKFLVLALILGIVLQVTAVSYAPISVFFKTVPLGAYEWIICALLSFMPIPIVELQKHFIK